MSEVSTLADTEGPRTPYVDAPHLLSPMASVNALRQTGLWVVTGAHGQYIQTADGREVFDAHSGLLNVNVGYGRTEIVEAVAACLTRISYSANHFGRGSHEIIELSNKLAELTPEGIERFIFSLGGSDAIDTGIKLVRHANVVAGRPEKMVVIARRGSFHGMTFGGTAVTGQPALQDHVGPMLPGVLYIDQPVQDGNSADYAKQLEDVILQAGAENVAALISDPFSVPAGIALPPQGYWTAVQDVCRRYDVRIILDEVITGFGRTGRMFASDHWGIHPDVLCLAKGLTSGYFPLGAVGISGDLYETLASSEMILPHGFTAGGVPAAAAAALANIAIIERENLVENAAAMGEYVIERLRELETRHACVTGFRSIGLVSGFDVDSTGIKGEGADAALTIMQWLLEHGYVVRAYAGKTIVFGTALNVAKDELDGLFEALNAALEANAV